jgi:hypothetical protein
MIGATALYIVARRLGENAPGMPAFDVYAYFYPNMLYALHALAGGRGLLWNPYQDCGQPFFAISSVGLLYPANVFFLLLDPTMALRAVLWMNLLVGGLGAWALARELGLGRAAAAGGTLAFVLGGPMIGLTVWMPTVQAPYAWLPAALFFCERLVRTGRLRHALWLGIVFAMALLPGHPQFALFSCELVVLRLLWSLADAAERRHAIVAAGGVALALVLMLLLTAVQYLPAMEVARESVRGAGLTVAEIAPGGNLNWSTLGQWIRLGTVLAPFTFVPFFVAVSAFAHRTQRRAALFYALAAALCLALAFGTANPVGRLYVASPLGHAFRIPMRFSIVTGFCVSVLVGIAVDALVKGSWTAVSLAAATFAGCRLWAGPLPGTEWWLAGAVLAGGGLAASAPTRRWPIALILGAVALSLVLLPPWTMQRYLRDDRALWGHAVVFDGLRARLTAQDRVHLAPVGSDPGFDDKTASLFGLRATTDYEGQVSRAYAEYLTMLRSGQPMRSLNQAIYPDAWNPQTVRWPLLHLTAARYLAVARALDVPQKAAPLVPLDGDDDVHVFENPSALPRAYYVSRIAVVPDANLRLQRLASGREDPRHVALVETIPPSGFVGVPGNDATAPASFIVDDPEHVVIELAAPERGFVFLADQYFPGWSATVNGEPAPITRANHAFRIVEVPRGPVRVEFRYRPASLWLGGIISATTLVAVLAIPIWGRAITQHQSHSGDSAERTSCAASQSA